MIFFFLLNGVCNTGTVGERVKKKRKEESWIGLIYLLNI